MASNFTKIFSSFIFLGISLSLCSQVVEKTYLTTDRDIYQLEDTLWFKGYVFNHRNFISNQSIAFHVVLSDENGNKVRDTSWPVVGGLAYGNIYIPREEGKYFLSAFSGQMINAAPELVFTKEIFVRSEIADEISLVTTLVYDSIHPSILDKVSLQANLSENEPASNERFSYELWSETESIDKGSLRTDESGHAQLELDKFDSPLSDLTLVVKSTDKGMTKPVQLATLIKVKPKKIDLQFFPEGGPFIQGIVNNIAFKAIDDLGRPIDINGVLMDASGNIIDSISSSYMGMGQFYLTPKPEAYSFKIIEPQNIDSLYLLPFPAQSGVAMNVFKSGNNLPLLKLAPSDAFKAKGVTIQISQNDQSFYSYNLKVDHTSFFYLPTEKLKTGIARVTLLDYNYNPIAERLFFAKAGEKLNVQIKTNKDFYFPREKTEVTLTVTDSENNPVQGNFSLSAIDHTRSKIPNLNQPNLMAQVLLNSELKGAVPTPNFYFTDDPIAKSALDLVMLTHGWRKYELDNQKDPEAMMGQVLHRKNKKKVIRDTELSLISLNTFESESIPVDNDGRFYLDSKYMKDKGDSFLLSTVVRNEGEKPNIILNDSTRLNGINFKKQLLSSE